MALFGESKAEKTERELRQEIDDLRQEIKALKENGNHLENMVDAIDLQVRNDKVLLRETMSDLSRIKRGHADLKISFVNFVAREKRKRLRTEHTERTKK